MSVASVSQTSVSTQLTSGNVELVFQPRNFLFLIPTISAIALGLIFFPHFGFGLAMGVADFVVTLAYTTLLAKTGILPLEEDNHSVFQKITRGNLFAGSVFIPIAEEGIFRGLLQPCCAQAIQILIPAAEAALFGPQLSIAVVASIVATSILFGAVHYSNPHKNAHIQALTTGIGSLALGFLSAQFGIAASIAAHMGFNTLISCVQALTPDPNRLVESRLPA